jgi:uncharacterized membrane protein YkvA (DUF1232 family)
MSNKQIEPKDIEVYQKHYSDDDFWSKVGRVLKKAGGKVIYCAILLYCVLKSPSVPEEYKLMIIGTLGYFILPVDLIPDFIPVTGYADDLSALIACYKMVKANVTPEIKAEAKRIYKDLFECDDVPLLD